MGKSTREITYRKPDGEMAKLKITTPLGKPMAQALKKAVKELKEQGCRIIEVPSATNGRAKGSGKPPKIRKR